MRRLEFVIACGLACASAAAAAETPSAPLDVHGAWARATPVGADVAVGYLVVDNHGAADRLVSVSTLAAERAELHSMRMDNGVMRMRQATEGLPIAAGAS